MAAQKKRIAIIGGGLCGNGSIVALKDEGFEPVCFEARDAPFGTWYYREESVVGYASIMPNTILINSKEMSAPSNFPPRKEHNNYMRHTEAYQYYMEYYKHFNNEPYIRFNTEVINVKKNEDYEDTGRFLVTVKDRISGEVSTDVYDGVWVCTGHLSVPKIEPLPGQEKFKGNVIHTHSLKRADKYKGQNVLVIGNGCSALDAADVLSGVAKQVYVSTRSGMFVISRLGPSGYPIDYILFRRYLNIFLEYLPPAFASWVVETFFLDPKFDHRLYSVKPKHHLLSKDPVVNDAIFSKLISGSVILKGKVDHFTENGVVFDGDNDVTEIDAVVMGTGYTWDFPFLEEGLLETENGRLNLYKCMYPTQLPHPTLVFIGLLYPFGPGIPVGEMQTRWAAHVLAGKGHLPSKKIMLKDAIERHRRNELRYTPSDFMSVRIDYIEYLDDLASQLGVKPNLLKYLFTDFPLFLKLVFGPFLPYQYRLEGPHKWEGARDAIMTCHDRVVWPLSRGNCTEKGVMEIIIEFIVNLIPRNIFLH